MSKKLEKEVEITEEQFDEIFRENMAKIESQQRKIEDIMNQYVVQYRAYQRAKINNVMHYYIGTDGQAYYEKTPRKPIGFDTQNHCKGGKND